MLPIITPPPLLTTATPPFAANLPHPLRVARGFGLRPPPLPRPPRWRSPTAWFACFALAAAGLHAQVIITLPGTPVTENFDALGSAEAYSAHGVR